MIPLGWSDLIQETLSEISARDDGRAEAGEGGEAKTRNAFSATNEYFAAPVSLSSATHETYAPFSTNKLSISKAFPVKMKDVAHSQGL